MLEWLFVWVLLSVNAIFMAFCVSYLFHRKHTNLYEKNEKSTTSLIDSLHNKIAREIQSRFQLSQEWNTVQSILEKFQKEHQNTITAVQQQEQQERKKWQQAYDSMNQQWKETYDTQLQTWREQHEQQQQTWYNQMEQEKQIWKQQDLEDKQRWRDLYEIEIQTWKEKYENEMKIIQQHYHDDGTWKTKYHEEMENIRKTNQQLVDKLPLIEKLQKENKDLTEVYEEMVTREGTLQQQLEESQTNQTELDNTNTVLQEQQKQFEQSLAHASSTSQVVKKQVDDLKQSFNDMKIIIQKLETHLTAELDDIRASFKDLQSIYNSHHETWSNSHSEFIRVITEFNDMHNKVQQQMINMKQQEHDWRDKYHTLWNQFRTSIESRLEDEMKQSHSWIVQVQQLREDQKETTMKQNTSEKQLVWLKNKLDHMESIQTKQTELQEQKFKTLEQVQHTIRDLSLSLTREEVTLRAIQQSQQHHETTYGSNITNIQKQMQNMGNTYKQQLDTFQQQVVRNYNTLVESLHHINERIGHEETNPSSLPKWQGPPQIY